MTAKLTADTITDEQIRELRADAVGRHDWAVVRDCNEALTSEHLAGDSVLDPVFATWVPNKAQPAARARCAEILNARNKEGK